MSLRIPNAPMEGLSIDVKKFASDASTFFNRARQFTEEQLGQGNLYLEYEPSSIEFSWSYLEFKVFHQ